MKGLLVSIYTDAQFGDSSNGGISGRFKEALLVGAGVPEIFDELDSRPTVKLVTRWAGTDREYHHVEPVGKWAGSGVGPMFGGSFCYTSDSRFPNSYPLPIHDRWESAELYETLSK